MLKAIERIDHTHSSVFAKVKLTYDERKRGRLKTATTDGEELGLFLERGKVLNSGNLLKTECGKIIEIQAADEEVTTATTDDWHNFAKTCYHLGNRHTPLEVGERYLRFQPDHVLEELCHLYGLTTKIESAPFNPENGAYGKIGGHSHGGHHHHDDEDHHANHHSHN